MIGDIRKSLQTPGVRLLIWAMLGSLLIGTVSMIIRFSGKSLEESIALVNGHDISIPEFRRKYHEVQNLAREIRQTYGPQAPMYLKMWGLDRRPDELVLDGLIGEKVMKSVTSSLGTSVHHEHVQAKLRDPYFIRQYLAGVIPPQALSGGSLDVAALQYNLQRQGISEEEFDELLNDALLRAFLFSIIEGGLYIPQEALKDAYISKFLKKKYAYMILPKSRYLSKAKEKKVTAAEVQQFYAQPAQKESYRIPEKRSAKLWTFTPEGFGVVIKDKDLKAEYTRNKRDYIKKPAEVDVQHILFTFTDKDKLEVRSASQEVLKKVKADPKKFAELAEQYSKSNDKGKTITVKRSDKNRAFTNAAFRIDGAFNLKKDGIAGVIETPDGFEIIKLIKKREPIFKTLDEVKDDLSKKLQKRKFARSFATQAQRVISQSRELPQTLTNFIERHKGKASSVKEITRSGKTLNERLFNLRRVGDRGFYQDGENGVIIEMVGVKQSLVPALKAIQEKVENDLYDQRAQELIKKDLDSARKDIRTGKKTLAQAAQALESTVELTGWVTFDDKDSYKKLQQAKFKLPEIAQLTRKGAIEADMNDAGGYLIQVKQIEPFKQESFEKKKDSVRKQLDRQELQGLSGAFIQTLRDKADITMNTQLLRQVARV